jgi:hypothetical protein
MKVSVLLAVLLAVGVAQAEVVESQNINQQQLSKRPYSTPVVEKNKTYEGDTNYQEEVNPKAEKNFKTLQLHMLGKRPYTEKNSD